MSGLTCCDHGIQWHHETRGCGYHGFVEGQRCPCLLTSEEALARAVREAEARGAAAVVERVEAVLATWGRRANEDWTAHCEAADHGDNDAADVHGAL